MLGSAPFHTKHRGKTNKRTDPEVFGLTEPAQSCPSLLQEQRGFFLSREGWLICHRSSFQSPLCTAAHLDADVRRLASCAEPVPLSVKQRGPEPKVAAFHFSATFFGGTLQCFCLSSDYMSPSLLSASLLVTEGRRRQAGNTERLQQRH